MLLFYTADKMESGKNMVSQGKVRENENLKIMATLRGSQIEIQEDMILFLSICRYEIKKIHNFFQKAYSSSYMLIDAQ